MKGTGLTSKNSLLQCFGRTQYKACKEAGCLCHINWCVWQLKLLCNIQENYDEQGLSGFDRRDTSQWQWFIYTNTRLVCEETSSRCRILTAWRENQTLGIHEALFLSVQHSLMPSRKSWSAPDKTMPLQLLHRNHQGKQNTQEQFNLTLEALQHLKTKESASDQNHLNLFILWSSIFRWLPNHFNGWTFHAWPFMWPCPADVANAWCCPNHRPLRTWKFNRSKPWNKESWV